MKIAINVAIAALSVHFLIGFAPAAQVVNAPLTAQQRARLGEARKLSGQVVELSQQGKSREAVPLARQALAIYQEVLGPKHPDTAVGMINLGAMLLAQGDVAGARPYYEQALAINREVRGPKHPDTAGTLNNMGFLTYEQGDLRGAKPYFEEALAIHLETLGPKHPDVALSLHNLGSLVDELGDAAAARPYFERALAIRKEVLGMKHRDTAVSLGALASFFRGQGNLAAARPLYEQALAIDRETLGLKHPSTGNAVHNLGVLLHTQGDFAAARPYYELGLAIRLETLGPKHVDTARSLHALGVLLEGQGQYAAARPYSERALAIRKEVLGVKHPDTAESLISLGVLLDSAGDYAAARPYYEQALAIRRETLGPKHPDTASLLTNLGVLLEHQRDFPAARAYYEQSLAIKQETLGPMHPGTALSLGNLSTLLAAEGSWERAAKLKDEARRIVREHVARVLPSLSAKEQAIFLKRMDEHIFHSSLSLGLVRRDDAPAAELSAGWLLNGKAVAQEALAQTTLLARESQDPVVGAAVKQLLELRRELAATALSAPKAGQEAARRDRLDRLQQTDDQLSRQIAGAKGEAPPAGSWVEVSAVRQAVPMDAVLIDIARFEVFDFAAKGLEKKWQAARYVAWLLPPAGKREIKLVDLGEAKAIDAAVQAVRDSLRQAAGTPAQGGAIAEQGEPEAEALLNKPLQELAKLALHPLIKEFGEAKQLILSPDAALWLVPWGALPLSDGRYAIEEFQIRYVASGRDLAARRGTTGQTAKPVIMADPNFDLTPTETEAAAQAVFRGETPAGGRLRSLAATRSSSTLPQVARLPGTAAEAKAIAPKLQEYAGGAPLTYTDQYALEGVFKAMKRPKAVVLSTHGFFLPDQEMTPENRPQDSQSQGTAQLSNGKPYENPLLRCGLLLAGCNPRGTTPATTEDGVLTGMEILGADLRGTELVVLSACETGLGQVQNGEGVAGLRQAFQLAGAQAVVATLWQIPDKESARLMTDFFTNLAAGQSNADALRSAQLALIKNRRDRYGAAHPLYWAAFTVTGQ